jgi:hypothetical protein
LRLQRRRQPATIHGAVATAPLSTDLPARAAAWRRLNRRMAFALSAANVTGALIVFVFLGLVVPTPSEVAYDWSLFWLNLAVFVPGLVLSVILANVWANASPPRCAGGSWPGGHPTCTSAE